MPRDSNTGDPAFDGVERGASGRATAAMRHDPTRPDRTVSDRTSRCWAAPGSGPANLGNRCHRRGRVPIIRRPRRYRRAHWSTG